MKPTKADTMLPVAHNVKDQPLLEHLSFGQVFAIRKVGKHTFQISEECDGYFGMDLTRAELRDLAAEIKKVADAP